VEELYNRGLSGVIILNTLNIIFAKVCAGLNLNENQLFAAVIANSMELTHLDGDRFTRMLRKSFAI